MQAQRPTPSEEAWMSCVYTQAGHEIRNEDTVSWATFSIALATNAVLVNAVFSLLGNNPSSMPGIFAVAPFVLGVFISWLTAYIVWRSNCYLAHDRKVAKKIEDVMAGAPDTLDCLTGRRLYFFTRPRGPHIRPIMVVALFMLGIGWLLAAGVAGFWWLFLPVFVLAATVAGTALRLEK